VYLFAGLVGIACGGEDEGELATSVPGSTPLNQLSAEQAAALCREVNAFIEASGFRTSSQALACKSLAPITASLASPASDAELVQGCSAAYQRCLAHPVGTTAETGEACGLHGTTCTATVAEYEACLEARDLWYRTAIEAYPECSEVTLKNVAAGSGDTTALTPPAECQQVEAKCSDFDDALH
jgi:hypothetical protein